MSAGRGEAGQAFAGLALEGVRHAFDGTPVINGIDLRVERGEIVCLLGPSGCGKTTTLRIAAGLEPLQHGRIEIGGREVARHGRSLPPERRRVGLMFQDYALFPHLRVVDNVAFGLAERGAAGRRIARKLLARVGLADYASDFPHVLSGGEQQRVALVRALAPEPVVMLLDEPFSGLDERLRDHIRDDTLRLLKSSGVATLLVTHNAEEAMFMADRIALMRAGQIVQIGAPGEIYRQPVNPFVAGFFGPINRFEGTVWGGAVETPVGRVTVPGLEEGGVVQVLIRPEGLHLAADGRGGAVSARVERIHELGPTTLVHMALDGSATQITARIAGSVGPQVGEIMCIHLDPGHAFVFPAKQEI